MKQDYIKEINRLAEGCNDLGLLDLICKIMEKSNVGGATACMR